MMKRFLIVFLLTISSTASAEELDLKSGDIHLNEWTGLFATKLGGDSAIVVNADYENETMNAAVINNVTGETHCLPRPCN
jgi:hypothetical protein